MGRTAHKREFRKLTESVGGPRDRTEFPFSATEVQDEVLAIFQDILRHGKSRHGLEVYCDWVNNPGFNAFATVSENTEFIAVYLGVLYRLNRYFFTFLSDPEVLPTLGEIEREELNVPALDSLRFVGGVNSAHPMCPQRFLAAQHLTFGATLFVFFHELAHVERCHLRLLRDELGVDQFVELPTSPINSDEARLRQMLEIDADVVAAKMSWQFWSSQWLQDAGTKSISGWDSQQAWAHCLTLLFYVMEASNPTMTAKNRSHLPPMARLLNIANNGSAIKSVDSTEPLSATLLGSIIEIEQWWSNRSLPLGSFHRTSPDQILLELQKFYTEFDQNYRPKIHSFQEQRLEQY